MIYLKRKDSNFRVTDTVMIKMETGDQHPIKNIPYIVT